MKRLTGIYPLSPGASAFALCGSGVLLGMSFYNGSGLLFGLIAVPLGFLAFQSIRVLLSQLQNNNSALRDLKDLVLGLIGGANPSKRSEIFSHPEMNELGQAINELADHMFSTRVSKDYLDGIFNTVPDLLFVLNSSGYVERANPMALTRLGCSLEYLQQYPFSKFLGNGKDTEILNLKTDGNIRNADLELKRQDGESIPVLVTISKMGFGTTDDGYVCIAKDTSELRALEREKRAIYQQLIQASKLASLGTLGAGVAHELNNPLTSVRGFAELIKITYPDLPDLGALADRIIRGAVRMQAIVDHLRRFTRDSSNDDWQPVQINQPIEEALVLLSQQLYNRGVGCDLKLGERLPPIFGDPNQVESVLQNLITNSRDAFDGVSDLRDKVVKIRTYAEGNSVFIEYSDNAGGIPESIIDRIFDPFFTTKEVGKGTGLGMSIARNIVEEHGGKIECNSKPGVGTTFLISFPQMEMGGNSVSHGKPIPIIADAEPAEISALPSTSSEIRPIIMVIDDERDVVHLLSQYLRTDYEVIGFHDPLEAIQEAEKVQKISLVLTDLKMPKMSGLDVLQHFQLKHPFVPVVIMSGHAKTEDDVKYAVACGAVDVLPKPFGRPNDIRNLVRQWIESGKQTAA